jgi:hypothetical protein
MLHVRIRFPNAFPHVCRPACSDLMPFQRRVERLFGRGIACLKNFSLT